MLHPLSAILDMILDTTKKRREALRSQRLFDSGYFDFGYEVFYGWVLPFILLNCF